MERKEVRAAVVVIRIGKLRELSVGMIRIKLGGKIRKVMMRVIMNSM